MGQHKWESVQQKVAVLQQGFLQISTEMCESKRRGACLSRLKPSECHRLAPVYCDAQTYSERYWNWHGLIADLAVMEWLLFDLMTLKLFSNLVDSMTLKVLFICLSFILCSAGCWCSPSCLLQAALTSALCATEKRHRSLSIDPALGSDLTSHYPEGRRVLGARAAGNDWIPMSGLLFESLQAREKSS